MEEKNITLKGIDEYILQFNPNIQEVLKTLRKVIKESAPEADENISYQMPTFYLYRNLIVTSVASSFRKCPGRLCINC